MEQWIDEFLYRGRAPGSGEAPSFHVIVGQQASDPFDENGPPIRKTIGPMIPAAAAALGLPLADLVSGVNAAAIDQLAILASRIAELEAALEAQAPAS